MTEQPPPTGPDLEATLEADLGTVTDDEYFAALESMPPLLDEDGHQVNVLEGVRDERQP